MLGLKKSWSQCKGLGSNLKDKIKVQHVGKTKQRFNWQSWVTKSPGISAKILARIQRQNIGPGTVSSVNFNHQLTQCRRTDNID